MLRHGRAVKFLPGQWLDVYVPDPKITKPGGFTITSEPRLARGLLQKRDEQSRAADGRRSDPTDTGDPYLELAVQSAASNPPAAWLCRNPLNWILGKTLHVRVGGSFVWPPLHRSVDGKLTRPPRAVIMIAGGVGINPFMSMISHLRSQHIASTAHGHGSDSMGMNRASLQVPPVTLMYGIRRPKSPDSLPLFIGQFQGMMKENAFPFRLEWYAGSNFAAASGTLETEQTSADKNLGYIPSRMTLEDVRQASRRALQHASLDKDDAGVVYYVCGPKTMTDEFVEGIKGFPGVHDEDVLCEKWW